MLASLVVDLTWVHFEDIMISFLSHPPLLFTDNINALHLTVIPIMHARTKHAKPDYRFVWEKVVQGSMVTRFIPSLQEIAGIFNKPLPKHNFQVSSTKLGVVQNPTTSLWGRDKPYELN